MIKTNTKTQVVETHGTLVTKGARVLVVPQTGQNALADGDELEALVHRGVVREVLKAEKAEA